MNEFSKLNRDQMRKITGGVGLPPEVCNVGGGCAINDPSAAPNPLHGLVLLGICNDTMFGGCLCVRENISSPTWMCLVPDETD